MQEEYLDQSILLSNNIQNNFKNNLNKKSEELNNQDFGYFIIHICQVFVRSRFISNPKEAAYLNIS